MTYAKQEMECETRTPRSSGCATCAAAPAGHLEAGPSPPNLAIARGFRGGAGGLDLVRWTRETPRGVASEMRSATEPGSRASRHACQTYNLGAQCCCTVANQLDESVAEASRKRAWAATVPPVCSASTNGHAFTRSTHCASPSQIVISCGRARAAEANAISAQERGPVPSRCVLTH